MPFKSEKQKGYLLAHPEITDKKGKPVGKKWAKKYGAEVSKGKGEWGKAVVAGTAAGALANQFPRVQDIAAERKRRKKAKVSKLLVPVSDDPFFNQAAAQKTFDLIMKMDDDTAEMFCHVLATDLLDDEIEKNLGTLQKHLDEVLAKRAAMVKKALVRTALDGSEAQAEEISKAWDRLEEITKDNDDIPDWIFERKINRDPGSGRFRTKINQTAAKKPIKDSTYAALAGDKNTKDKAYTGLSDEQKAKYQNEYLQVKRFLDAVELSAGKQNADVFLHFKDEGTGETWVDMHGGGKPPASSMLKEGVTVTAAEARPNTLTVGGAAFSLSGALGGNQMTPGQVEAINAFNTKYGKPDETGFAGQWMKEGDAANANARLYGRTKLLGEVAGTIGPPGSKVQLAGKMADIVGQYGPQAEQVLGPSARKTAYRYRGTEREPDERLVEMYSRAIEQNKRIGPLDPWTEREEARIRQARGAGKQPLGSETGVRAKGSYQRRAEAPTAPAIQQMVAQREARMGRAPKWQERELGRRAVETYLSDRLPRKDYYKLHLEAGNTPPSEGVIINAEGQIVAQASGYGDDHYLPFNLKNLKGLKGGEYVRNRSVGGLTSEDIYTGLISGARRVTVVSRSGTFTMEFQPDFRGGRRHNDKARRMTRRYEHILDAVQSEQVDRQDVPEVWKKVIAAEVKNDYGPTATRAMLRTEIDARIKEFKENPQIDGRDMDRAEAAISDFEAQQRMGLVSSQDVADYRKDVLNELRNMKEVRFRLNGVGYAAALDSLEEQFPYYIHSMSRPKEEHLEEFERDLGYVEPARNRPSAAKAGWHGTAARKFPEKTGKYSAAHADYQRGLPGTPPPLHGPKAAPATAEARTPETPGTKKDTPRLSERERLRNAADEAVQEFEGKAKVKRAALELQQEAKKHPPPTNRPEPEWWKLEADDFRAYIEKPENLAKFHADANLVDAASWAATAPSAWLAYQNAVGGVSAKKYDKAVATIFPPHPYTFKDAGEAFRPNPPAGVVQAVLTNLGRETTSLTLDVPISDLTDAQMRDEVELIANVLGARNKVEADAGRKLTTAEATTTLGTRFKSPGSGHVQAFFRDGPDKHLENLHKARYLKKNPGTGPIGGMPPAAPPAPPAAPPETPATPPSAPSAPAAPAQGRLKPVEKLTPEQEKGKADHVSKLRTAYVDKLIDEGRRASGDEAKQKISYYAQKIKGMPATEVSDLEDMIALEMIDDSALLTRIKDRIEKESIR